MQGIYLYPSSQKKDNHQPMVVLFCATGAASLHPFDPGYEPEGRITGGLRGSAASGGDKRPKKQGRHLRLRKQRAAQMLSANPDRRFKSGSRNHGWQPI